MIPFGLPIPFLLIIYFCSKTFVIFYMAINYLLASLIYIKLSKYYFPKMKIKDCKEKQYFHEDFPSFNRVELASIHFGSIYYGLLNFFWIRLILVIITMLGIWLRIKLHFRGRNMKEEYNKDDREFMKKSIANSMVRILIQFMGTTVIEQNMQNNEKVLKVLKKYLGEDYNPEEYKYKYTTLISNHIAWIDFYYIMSKEAASFIAKASIEKFPIFGYFTSSFRSIFINRNSQDSKSETLTLISERQNAFAEGKTLFPLCLSPEGTTGNGRTIMTFKKGAFFSLTPIKIYLFKIDNSAGSLPLCFSTMNPLLHICLGLTRNVNLVTACEFPVIAPNDYLFKNFANLGKNKPEIYTEACRHIMSEVAEINLTNSGFTDKLAYLSMIKGREIKNT